MFRAERTIPNQSRSENPKYGGLFFVLAMGGLSLAAFLPLAACTTTSDDATAVAPVALRDDAEYFPVLQKWTKEAHLFSQFQKRIDVHATLLTDEFRQAYAGRWARLRGDSGAQLENLGGTSLGVVLSVFTPDDPYMEIENRALWSVTLKYGTQTVPLTQARKLPNKPLFQPYFHFINQWTQETLLVFDVVPGGDPSSKVLALPQTLSLSLRSALANVDVTWR